MGRGHDFVPDEVGTRWDERDEVVSSASRYGRIEHGDTVLELEIPDALFVEYEWGEDERRIGNP